MLSSREVMILFLTFESLTHLELDWIAVMKDPQKLYFFDDDKVLSLSTTRTHKIKSRTSNFPLMDKM